VGGEGRGEGEAVGERERERGGGGREGERVGGGREREGRDSGSESERIALEVLSWGHKGLSLEVRGQVDRARCHLVVWNGARQLHPFGVEMPPTAAGGEQAQQHEERAHPGAHGGRRARARPGHPAGSSWAPWGSTKPDCQCRRGI